MCLAVPARVEVLLPGEMARVSLHGVKKDISVELLDDVGVGDYVIVHVGYALNKLDPQEAAKTLELFDALRGNGAQGAGPP